MLKRSAEHTWLRSCTQRILVTHKRPSLTHYSIRKIGAYTDKIFPISVKFLLFSDRNFKRFWWFEGEFATISEGKTSEYVFDKCKHSFNMVWDNNTPFSVIKYICIKRLIIFAKFCKVSCRKFNSIFAIAKNRRPYIKTASTDIFLLKTQENSWLFRTTDHFWWNISTFQSWILKHQNLRTFQVFKDLYEPWYHIRKSNMYQFERVQMWGTMAAQVCHQP